MIQKLLQEWLFFREQLTQAQDAAGTLLHYAPAQVREHMKTLHPFLR